MFDEVKTLLVERSIKCPMCDRQLQNGDTMFKDEARGEIFCGHCSGEYKRNIILEEGEDGRLLK